MLRLRRPRAGAADGASGRGGRRHLRLGGDLRRPPPGRPGDRARRHRRRGARRGVRAARHLAPLPRRDGADRDPLPPAGPDQPAAAGDREGRRRPGPADRDLRRAARRRASCSPRRTVPSCTSRSSTSSTRRRAAPPARRGRSGSGATPEREPGQDLAHDALGDERRHIGRADRRRQHLDDVGSDEPRRRRDLRGTRAGGRRRSSRPARACPCRARTPGRARRRRPSGTSGRRRPPRAPASTTASIPRSRTSCMKIDVIPRSACQPNSTGPGQ